MNVIILGASGMLGNAVAKQFIEAGYKPLLTSRRSSYDLTFKTFPLQQVYTFEVDAETPPNWRLIKEGDYVINCIGIIKPFVEKVGPANTIYVNSVFPHLLANYCAMVRARLIHITTDCVFSGKNTVIEYVESDPHDAEDLYGKSKSMGEPITNAMVIRTSIIGDEIHNDASLVAWVKSQKGMVVNGYHNHEWNGITTNTYGDICKQIIENDLWNIGLYHIYSSTSSPTYDNYHHITKYYLLQLLNKKFDLNLTIKNTSAPQTIRRALRTEKDLCTKLNIPTIEQQIEEM